ncbi:unnamed protein product [Prunus brigantina]
MYPVVQRAQIRGRSEERRFGHRGCKVALRISVHANNGVPAWFSLLMTLTTANGGVLPNIHHSVAEEDW